MPQGAQATSHDQWPAGLRLAQDVISEAEEAALIALIETSGLAYKSFDPGNPRCSTSFGWTYDFLADTFVPCAPVPEGFAALRDLAARFAGVPADDLVECLLNRYDPGAIIQPHRDKPVWDHVIGVSLGASATMEFRRDAGTGSELLRVELPPRSLYLLAGDARHVYTHALPPMEQTRWSVTFRSYSEEGRRLRDAIAA